MVRFLKQFAVGSIFFVCSVSAFAFSCFPGGFGHCIWGFDARDPGKTDLIDSTTFLKFCTVHQLYCSSNDQGYTSIMGRYLDEEVFVVAGPGFGGPDLIFDDKNQAELFIDEFTNRFNDTLFFVRNFNSPVKSAVAVGYYEETASGSKHIKLLFFPNEWKDSGYGHEYSPPDM